MKYQNPIKGRIRFAAGLILGAAIAIYDQIRPTPKAK